MQIVLTLAYLGKPRKTLRKTQLARTETAFDLSSQAM